MRVLHLTLKKKWFDMIASGEKLEEYREIKPYWEKRLRGQQYDAVKFRNGYRPDSPTVTVKLRGIYTGVGVRMWGATGIEPVFILKLGDVLSA